MEHEKVTRWFDYETWIEWQLHEYKVHALYIGSTITEFTQKTQIKSINIYLDFSVHLE